MEEYAAWLLVVFLKIVALKNFANDQGKTWVGVLLDEAARKAFF